MTRGSRALPTWRFAWRSVLCVLCCGCREAQRGLGRSGLAWGFLGASRPPPPRPRTASFPRRRLTHPLKHYVAPERPATRVPVLSPPPAPAAAKPALRGRGGVQPHALSTCVACPSNRGVRRLLPAPPTCHDPWGRWQDRLSSARQMRVRRSTSSRLARVVSCSSAAASWCGVCVSVCCCLCARGGPPRCVFPSSTRRKEGRSAGRSAESGPGPRRAREAAFAATGCRGESPAARAEPGAAGPGLVCGP